MGSIIVGQKRPKTVNMGVLTITPSQSNPSGKKQELSAEEKARIVKNIMALPKDQIVPALRKNGFNEIADITEAEMKADAEAKAKADARETRLKEILALPADEQLPLLLAEGYEEEAKELSEKLATEQGNGDGEGDKTDTDDGDGDGTTDTEDEPEKKKGGRPKKTEQ